MKDSCAAARSDACKLIGYVHFLSLLWVGSQQLTSLNVCGEFNLRRVSSFAFAAEGANKMAKYCCGQFCHQAWKEAACERPWKAIFCSRPLVDRACYRQALQMCLHIWKKKKKRRIRVSCFTHVWNKLKQGSLAFLCLQTRLWWKEIIIRVSFMVVILQVIYFKWLPPGCIRVARHRLIARGMKFHKSMACKNTWRRDNSYSKLSEKERILNWSPNDSCESSGDQQKNVNMKIVLNTISYSL